MSSILKTYQPTEVIFREGLPGSTTYIVKSGCVEISSSRRGKKLVLAMLGEGEIFGEMAPMDGGTRCATACAATRSEVWCIRSTGLREMVEQSPPFVQAIFAAMIRRVRHLDAKLGPSPVSDSWVAIAQTIDLACRIQDPRLESDTVVLDLAFLLQRLPEITGANEPALRLTFQEMAAEGLFRLSVFPCPESISLDAPSTFLARVRLKVAQAAQAAKES